MAQVNASEKAFDLEESKANAALIAEAPAMYRALEDLTDILFRMGEHLTESGKEKVRAVKSILNRIKK